MKHPPESPDVRKAALDREAMDYWGRKDWFGRPARGYDAVYNAKIFDESGFSIGLLKILAEGGRYEW